MRGGWTLGILAGDVATAAGGGLAAAAGFARLMSALRERVPRCLLACPVTELPAADRTAPIAWPADDLIPLPPLLSTLLAQRHWAGTWRAIRELEHRSDVLLVRWPFQLPFHLLGLQRPKVIHVVADVAAVVGASAQRGWLAGAVARGFARLMEACARRIAHEPRTRAVTNGSPLLRLLRATDRGRAVVSSALHASEIPPLEHRPLHTPPRLLFVGSLRPEKGLDTLLTAMERLSASRPIELTVAGGDDRASAPPLLPEGAASHNVRFTGAVTYGEPLFRLFREHDLLVLPSRSEGTPRVLVEARAFSCPVVATRVGGIPDSVTHEDTGLLVPPGDPAALAGAISRVLDDAALRARLVERGYAAASAWTVEAYAGALVDEVTRVLTEQRA